jgi:hypothetical protein
MANFNSWDDAAEHVIASLEWEVRTGRTSISDFEVVEQFVSAWILGLQAREETSKSDTAIATAMIIKAGILALQEIKDKEIHYAHEDMVKLLVRKQHDYGHDNINNFGIIGIAVRVCDKIARIRNLKGRDTDGVAEPLADSYLDLVGYAAIAQMYHHGWFQLELESDMK